MMQGQMQAAPGMPKPMGEPEVIRNLMVNYIPTTIDEVQLRQLFEMYGPVESVKIVVDRETRTSKGYGFVKFRFAFSAVHAIQYLNGYPLMNKRLKVAYSNQAEAQKILTGQPSAEGGYQQYAQHPAGGQGEMEAQQLWAQQMYMQQLAALQMMQYQSMPHQHAHQHQHQHQQHQHQHQHQQRQPHQHQHNQQQQPPQQQSPQQQQQSPAQPQQPQPAVESPKQ
jgi:RNA recognition motif-containing protein